MSVRLSDRQLATILAALRFWQQQLDESESEPPIREHFEDDITPLTIEEIDAFCERLNCRTIPD
jgi:hypothetical protein